MPITAGRRRMPIFLTPPAKQALSDIPLLDEKAIQGDREAAKDGTNT